MNRPSARALVLLLFATPFAAHAQDDVAERIRRVEQGLLTPVILQGTPPTGMSLTERMANYRVPGVSIAVINNGRIEWAKAYGVTEAGGSTPVDTSTLFQAASISKPVGGMAALRLVEQDQLALDDDVNTRLRSWRVPENGFMREQKVTLRRLLSHNAGMTVHGFRGYAQAEAVPTLVQLLDGTRPANSAAVRVDTVPGAIWRYSGGGISVAQLLLEDVTGRSFPELMRESVLAPAGMIHSTYEQPLPPERAAHAATGHSSTGLAVNGKWHTYPEMFAAGLWTTPSDLARLAIEVQRSLRGESNRIISRDMTRQMLTVQAGGTGLGFGVQQGAGWLNFSHGGANAGFRALFQAFDSGQGVVIMTNSDQGAQLAGEIARAVAREYRWPIGHPTERAATPIDSAALQAFVGRFTGVVNGTAQTLVFSRDGSTLRMAGPLGLRVLHYAGADAFFTLELPATLRFERDATGAVMHVGVTGVGAPVRLTRVQTPF